MAVQTLSPPQVPSDNAHNFTSAITHVAGAQNHTQTYTIPKLTTTGSTGSMTVTNGKVTAYTPPT